jgi:hypothetical protein
MVFKSLIAAAAIAGTTLTAAATAEAKPKFDIYVDLGDGYSDAGYGYGDGHGYDEGGYGRGHGGWRISCGEGREKVRWAGFRKVRPIDCDGRTYQYKARKHGDWFVVTVKSKNGRIVNVDPLY